jgi:hypothetical protein
MGQLKKLFVCFVYSTPKGMNGCSLKDVNQGTLYFLGDG